MNKHKVAWILNLQRPGSGSYQRIRKLMEDFGSLFDANVTEYTFARIPLSINEFLALFKTKPVLNSHKRFVIPLLLPGGRFGFIRSLNSYILKCCGHIIGFFVRPNLIIGEYAFTWPSVEACAGYRSNSVTWIDIHGAAPEEAIYTNPQFKNIEAVVDDMRRTEKNAVEEVDILTVQSDVMTMHLSKIHNIPVKAISYQCGVDTKLFLNDEKLRQNMREQLGYLADDFVFVYAGGTAKWQMLPQTLRMISALNAIDRHCKGLILTNGNHSEVQKLAESCGLSKCNFRLLSAKHHEVPHFLTASDIGILLRVDHVVNRVACPTKLGEYLACGLPVILGPASHHWPWLKSDGICHIIENIDHIDHQLLSILSFAKSVAFNGPSIRCLCRAAAISELSRNRDRIELASKVVPYLHSMLNRN